MRTLGIALCLACFGVAASDNTHADCEGGAIFPEQVLALDRDSIGWSTPRDIAYIKGHLASLPTYTGWIRGALNQASTLDISHDAPLPGQAFFYLVKPAGPPCGSWQSADGLEPGRDVGIQPPCNELNPSAVALQAAIDAALAAAPNPWADPAAARLFQEVSQDALGCTFDIPAEAALAAVPADLVSLSGEPPQYNQYEYYCGLDSALAALEMPAGPCLNLTCFFHDSCYDEHCVGGVCPFSSQTDAVGCDDPLVEIACDPFRPPPEGCLQSDGWWWSLADQYVCMVANTFTAILADVESCSGDPCDDGLPCSLDSCAPWEGCQHAVQCDDANSCTLDVCIATGCEYALMLPGSLCGDRTQTPCDEPDRCDGSGNCLPNHAPPGTPCDEGTDACTVPGFCGNHGTCSLLPRNCNDENPCTDDSCNPATGCVSTTNGTCTTIGCADGTREGLINTSTFPSIAACAGPWSGRIDESGAGALCAAGWHVCSPAASAADRQILGTVSYAAAIAVPGCFPFNAAHDNGTCVPCTGTQPSDDMGAVGANCTGGHYNSNSTSCLGSGRVDADCCFAYTTDHACKQNTSNPHTGVVCCRD